MSSPPRTVVLDCVGTLFSYSALFTAIDTRLGDKLRVEGVKPILFGYIRIEVAEREYIYLSMSGKYHSFATILQALFWRDAVQSRRSFSSGLCLTRGLRLYHERVQGFGVEKGGEGMF